MASIICNVVVARTCQLLSVTRLCWHQIVLWDVLSHNWAVPMSLSVILLVSLAATVASSRLLTLFQVHVFSVLLETSVTCDIYVNITLLITRHCGYQVHTVNCSVIANSSFSMLYLLFPTVLGANSLNCADMPLNNKQRRSRYYERILKNSIESS